MEKDEKIKKLEEDIKNFPRSISERMPTESIMSLIDMGKVYLEIQNELPVEKSNQLYKGIQIVEKIYKLQNSYYSLTS